MFVLLQELVAKDRTNRKRTCLILGCIAIGAIIVLVTAIVITSGGTKHGLSTSKLNSDAPAITLDDFLEGRLIPRSFNGTWVSGMYCVRNYIICHFICELIRNKLFKCWLMNIYVFCYLGTKKFLLKSSTEIITLLKKTLCIFASLL